MNRAIYSAWFATLRVAKPRVGDTTRLYRFNIRFSTFFIFIYFFFSSFSTLSILYNRIPFSTPPSLPDWYFSENDRIKISVTQKNRNWDKTGQRVDATFYANNNNFIIIAGEGLKISEKNNRYAKKEPVQSVRLKLSCNVSTVLLLFSWRFIEKHWRAF